jgi:RNA polymerase sigma factor (sigma-70 family)
MKGPDTSMGGHFREFPPTPGFIKSAPGAALSPSDAAFEDLARLYWKPVYQYFRTVGALSNDDSKDLAQQFFLHLLKGSTLERYRPELASFRVYLKTCLKNFLVDALRQRDSLKRGGDRSEVPLETAEARVAAPEDSFDQAWLESVLEAAIEEVRRDLAARGRGSDWAIFEAYDLRDPGDERRTYADLGRAHGMTESEVRGALAYVRGKLKERVVAQIRRGAASPSALREELEHLGFL